MKKIVLIVLCLVFASVAFAQNAEDHGCKMMAKQQEQMDAKLQPLLDTMNKATGQEKVDAMAAVITELIAQRTASHSMECCSTKSKECCSTMAKPATKSR